MTRSEFLRLYADTLRERALSDPEYEYAAAEADRTAAAMLPSLADGRADVHGSPVLRTLARRLGVPHTLAGWRAFAGSLTEGRCRECGEPGNTVPYSMAGTAHRYGPTTHDYAEG